MSSTLMEVTRPQSSTATVSPSCTVCPSATTISRTTPARGASTGISIFIDSRTITGSPAATESPVFAVIWKTTPVMWALTSSAIECSLLDHLRVHPARAKGRAFDHAALKRDHGLDAVEDARVEGTCHPADRFVTSESRRDQLGQQRIVVYRNVHPLRDSTLEANAGTRRKHE